MKCSDWKKERRSSGATLHARTCGTMKATILLGTKTYTITRNGKYVTKGSGKTLRSTKAAATRRMRRGR